MQKDRETASSESTSTAGRNVPSQPQMLVSVQEYKCHNADILLKEDSTIDDLIDVIEVGAAAADSQLKRAAL